MSFEHYKGGEQTLTESTFISCILLEIFAKMRVVSRDSTSKVQDLGQKWPRHVQIARINPDILLTRMSFLTVSVRVCRMDPWLLTTHTIPFEWSVVFTFDNTYVTAVIY